MTIKPWEKRVEAQAYSQFVKEGYSLVHAAMMEELADLRAYAEQLERDLHATKFACSDLRRDVEQLERERDALREALQNVRDYRTDVDDTIAARSMRLYADMALTEPSQSPQPVGAVVAIPKPRGWLTGHEGDKGYMEFTRHYDQAKKECDEYNAYERSYSNSDYEDRVPEPLFSEDQMRAALAAQTPAQQSAIDAKARVSAYIQRRKNARKIDIESIHAFDMSPEGGIELLLSDLEALLAAAPSQQAAA